MIQPRTWLASAPKVKEVDILAEMTVMPNGTLPNGAIRPDSDGDIYKTGDDL